jgi:hypothetical protein
MAATTVHSGIRTPSRAIQRLIEQLRAEYAEMPGLSVTLPQAQRLWATDRTTCEAAFDHLISRRVLRKTTRGRFVRI